MYIATPKRIAKALLFLVTLALTVAAYAQPVADAAFSTERLARIDHLLQQYVDQNEIAGAVALVLHDGKPVYERAVGWSDKEAGRRIDRKSVV